MRLERRPIEGPTDIPASALFIKNVACKITYFSTAFFVGQNYFSQMLSLRFDKREIKNFLLNLRRDFLKIYLPKEEFVRFNTEDILRAPCLWEELARQNRHLNVPGLEGSASQLQTELMATVGSNTILQEFIHQGFVHEILLTRIPKLILGKIAPGQQAILDSYLAKVIRIVLAVGLYAAWKPVDGQRVLARCVTGLIRESRMGSLGAIGVRLGYDIGVLRSVMPC